MNEQKLSKISKKIYEIAAEEFDGFIGNVVFFDTQHIEYEIMRNGTDPQNIKIDRRSRRQLNKCKTLGQVVDFIRDALYNQYIEQYQEIKLEEFIDKMTEYEQNEDEDIAILIHEITDRDFHRFE